MQYRRSRAKGAAFFFTVVTQCHAEFKGGQPNARLLKSEQVIWQHRFWGHQIRDDGDFAKHVEYIHFNPLKYGLVNSPKSWPHSTFHRFVKQGIYPDDWGADKALDFDKTVGNE